MRNKIMVIPEIGIGDIIRTTRVLKSISKSVENSFISVCVEGEKRDLLEGVLEENGGFRDGGGVDEIVDRGDNLANCDLLVDLRGYLNLNQALKGKSYSDSLINMAEEQLNEQGLAVRLRRDVSPEVRFDNVLRFGDDVQKGKNRIKEIKERYRNKEIIWMAKNTVGSANRMPQNYAPLKRFWESLIDRFGDKYVFYDLKADNELPIDHGKIEPKERQGYNLATQSEIIKGAIAGVCLDSSLLEFAYALGKSKMIVLLGPTHPGAVMYEGMEENMAVIPSIGEFDKLPHCRGCGIVGYSSPKSYEEKREVMKTRVLRFEFDSETREALKSGELNTIGNAGCREIKQGEYYYDCWQSLSVDKVANDLEKLAAYKNV